MRGKLSVHVEMRRKREIYLLVLGETTRSSPEVTKAHRACADTRHGGMDGSSTRENVSVTPDLPARGAVSHMGEPEGPRD